VAVPVVRRPRCTDIGHTLAGHRCETGASETPTRETGEAVSLVGRSGLAQGARVLMSLTKRVPAAVSSGLHYEPGAGGGAGPYFRTKMS
jgi:hypothetical protein